MNVICTATYGRTEIDSDRLGRYLVRTAYVGRIDHSFETRLSLGAYLGQTIKVYPSTSLADAMKTHAHALAQVEGDELVPA